MTNITTLDFITRVAEIPSFTTYEERLIPYIEEALSDIPGAELALVADNNVIVKVPGNTQKPNIALSAHLDKINHFGKDWIKQLPVSVTC